MKKKRSSKKAPTLTLYEQVGISKHGDRFLRYSDIPEEHHTHGWVKLTKYRPLPFDLVFLRIKGRDKPTPGWWTGTYWEGLRMKPTYIVTSWKRAEDCA